MFVISLHMVLTLAAFAPSQVAVPGPDSDGDGVPDAIDICPETPEGTIVDERGRPLGDIDGDCDVDLDDYAVIALNFTGPLDVCTMEVCDGIDNDCNGAVDDLGTVECGLGSCRRVVERCVGGLPNECVPGDPSPENCADQIENDCDGLTDCVDGVDCPFHTPCSPGLSCDRAGRCSCANGFDDCDGNAGNGCERSIHTLKDCGACNVACDYPNATESCSTGTCQFTGCFNGFCNRDSSTVNGCEVNLNLNPSCSLATFLGSISGDVGAGFLNASGAGERWYRVTITENDSNIFNPVYLGATVGLQVPPGADYDLYVYCSACGGSVTYSANGGGATEIVSVRRNDQPLGQDDTFDILIEIRFFAGSGSGGCDWILRVDGNTSVPVANCLP